MKGTVGVAIPAYGRGHYLATTLESLLTQTRPADEIVVVDDCSPDNTREVALAFANRGITYVQNTRNLGVPYNYNLSLGLLKSDYVFILEDHDILQPTFIERSTEILDTRQEVVLTFTAVGDIDAAGVIRRENYCQFPPIVGGRSFAKRLVTGNSSYMGLSGVLMRRITLTNLDPWYDPRYQWYADIEFLIRLSLKGDIGYIKEPLLLMREREAGHHLTDREWESLLCVDRIRSDCWSLVFPSPSAESWWRRRFYELGRLHLAIPQMVRDIAHGRRFELEDMPEEVKAYFGPIGRMLARIVSKLSPSQASMLRSLYHWFIVAPVIGPKRSRMLKRDGPRSASDKPHMGLR